MISIALATALGVMLGCGDAASPSTTVPNGIWGSADASLTVTDTAATLLILAGGGCYGSFGRIDLPIPNGRFSRTGTFTQLTNTFPGYVDYAAQYDGEVDGDQISISVDVPELERLVGPFHLTAGVTTTWPACQYP